MCNKKQCVIWGSGFGLYGYLPAAVNCGYQVFGPKRYQTVFVARKELLCYTDDVFFIENEKSVLKKGSLCIIAKRPEDQYILAQQISNAFGAEKIVLEKPLAPTPEKARKLCKLLLDSHENIHIGYSFLYTEWGKRVCKSLTQKRKASLSIEWTFMAHHFQHNIDNWKRYMASGGGALRFYGIQLIGILAVADNWEVVESSLYCTDKDENVCWKAKISCRDSCLVEICVNSKSETQKFCCHLKEKDTDEYLYERKSPFIETVEMHDCRVPILEQIISFEGDQSVFIKRSIELWSLIEKKSRIVIVD